MKIEEWAYLYMDLKDYEKYGKYNMELLISLLVYLVK
jgi:hypothetical protein